MKLRRNQGFRKDTARGQGHCIARARRLDWSRKNLGSRTGSRLYNAAIPSSQSALFGGCKSMIRVVMTLLTVLSMAAPAVAASRILVVSRDDKALKSYDATTYEQQFSIKLPGEPHEVAVSPDGRLAFSSDFEGRDNTLSIIDLEQQSRVGIKLDPYFKPHALAVTRDGSKVYVTCEASRVVVEFDVAAQKVTRNFKLTVDSAHNLTLSPDDKWLLVTSQWDNNVTIIDLGSGETRKMLSTGKGAEGVAVTPDGKDAWVV